MNETRLNNKDMDSIIAKVLSKEADIAEIVAFGDWVSESIENRREMEILTEFWEGKKMDENPLSTEFSFNKMEARLFGENFLKSESAKPNGGMRKLLLSIAASLLLLFAVGGTLLLTGTGQNDNYILQSQNDIMHATLPDSSKVVLNKNSKLTYTGKFLTGDRIVELEGEAYFEVEKKDRKKFIVQVGRSQIEVLGTKFDVNARNADERIVTTLVEGTVLFRHADQAQLMSPNHQLTFYTRSGLMENVEKDAYLNTEWKDNIYRYDSIRMREIIRQLEERYGVEIAVGSRYGDVRVSGAFHRDQSLEKVLRVMQEGVGFRWRMDDGKIVIY